MRPKFVLAVLLLAALALVAALYLNRHLGNVAAAPAAPESGTTAPLAASNGVTSVSPPAAPAPIPALAGDTNTLTDDQRQANIDTEVEHLRELSMNDDPASLANILADLTSADKEIREAAIEAAKEFGSPSAIPALKAAANNT